MAPRRQPARQRDPARGSTPPCLDAIANRNLEGAVRVLELGHVDDGLALAADVDQRDLRADRDDRALDGLAPGQRLRLDRRLEQRGEIL